MKAIKINKLTSNYSTECVAVPEEGSPVIAVLSTMPLAWHGMRTTTSSTATVQGQGHGPGQSNRLG